MNRWLLGPFLVVLLVLLAGETAPAQAQTTCTDSLQAKIDAAPSGGTVTADACIYREQVSITKPLTLVGQSGSEIRGSDAWPANGSGNWDRFQVGGLDYWRSTHTLPQYYQEDTPCYPGTKDCAYPEQMFRDGAEMTQIYSGNPASGQFRVDPDRTVVVGENPANVTYEATMRQYWVTGGPNADGVTVKGFTMKHAANEWRSGAIMPRAGTTLNSDGSCCQWSRDKADGSDWNVLDSDLSYAHGAVLSLRGSNANIENNSISHGGQLGVHNPGDGSIVRGNTITENNDQKFCIEAGKCDNYNTDTPGRALINQNASGSVEAGGIKVAGNRDNVTVDDNEVSANFGRGIWSDVGNTNQDYTNNLVHHNYRSGIFYEISSGGTITGNVVYENGWGTPGSNGGGGISVTSSQSVDVGNNTVAWNADGIYTQQDSRGALSGVNIHDNRILASDTPTLGDSTKVVIGIRNSTSTTNKSVNNKIYFPTAENSTYNRFYCQGSAYKTLANWNGSACTPSTNDSYMSSATKDSVVATYGLPATQEAH